MSESDISIGGTATLSATHAPRQGCSDRRQARELLFLVSKMRHTVAQLTHD